MPMKHEKEIIFGAYIANIGRFYDDGPAQLAERCAGALSHVLDVPVLLAILRGKEGYEEGQRIIRKPLRFR